MTLFLVLQKPWPAMVRKIVKILAFEMCNKGLLRIGLDPRAAVGSGVFSQPASGGGLFLSLASCLA